MNTTSVNLLPAAAHAEQRNQAFILACIAGYVDAHTLLRFHVYASFMSGNTTRAGVDVAVGQPGGSVLNLLAVLFFLIGAFLGAVLLHSPARPSGFATLLVTLTLLIVDIVTGAICPSPWLSVGLLSTAMGCLNSTITRIGGQPINIGFVSGELYRLAEHLALAYRRLPVDNPEGPDDTHLRRAALIATLWGMFLGGAFAGGLAEHFAPTAGVCLPVAALIGILAARLRRRASLAGEPHRGIFEGTLF
jgi:uncharacterized membrane protein YoaK (UPF0700 family)